MLVLSRKSHESVVFGAVDGVGGELRVTVLEIGHGSVRLGFEANKNVVIHREEVWERICKSRPCDLPIRGPDRATSSGANGKATVLFGTGQGSSPESAGGRV